MTTISGAGAHGAAALTDRLPASKDGTKGYLTVAMMLAVMRSELMEDDEFVDAVSSLSDAMVFKGVIDCSANPNYPAANRGETYRVSVAGKIGGGSGVNVEASDLLTCLTDSTASGNHATVGSAWTISQGNVDGAVIGVSSSLDGEIALFDSTSGKLLKRGATVEAAVKSQTYTLSYGSAARSNDSRWGDKTVMRDFGGAGTTAQVLQAAIDYAATGLAASPPTRPAEVILPEGVLTLAAAVNLKDRVILTGQGKAATVIKAGNGLNATPIKTLNFATLQGTNKFQAADGVLSFVGLRRLRIDGNKANQSAGNALDLYAKGLILDEIAIHDAYGCGIYSEAGEDPGVTTWDTAPEGYSNDVTIDHCGSHAWHMRGPHDLAGGKFTAFSNGAAGLFIESSSGVYLATADFQHIHCYANTGKGLHVKNSALVKAAIARLEDNYQEGLYLENADLCAFAITMVSDNCRTSGSYQVEVDSASDRNQILGLNCRDLPAAGVGGVRVNGGDENTVRGYIRGNVLAGGGSTSVGMDLANAARSNKIDVTVANFVGTGGIGLRMGQTSAVSQNEVRAHLYNNETEFNNANQGSYNRVELTGYTNTTAMSGATQGPTDEWDIAINQNGTRKSSHSGSYTPTLTGVSNVSSSTAFTCRWTRRGDVVTITGSISVTATAAAATYIGISLPPEHASNFSSSADASGTCSCDDAQQAGNVSADATNDRIQLGFLAANTSAHTMMFAAQYQVK